MQAKIGPALHKLDQALKGVQSQAVIPIVRQVGHEDADLKRRRTWDAAKAGNGAVSSWLVCAARKRPFAPQAALPVWADKQHCTAEKLNIFRVCKAAETQDGRRDTHLSVTSGSGGRGKLCL